MYSQVIICKLTLALALTTHAFGLSQGTIYFTTNPGTAGAPLTSTVSGSTGVADFVIGSSTFEVTAVTSNGVVLAGYTLTPGGPIGIVGGRTISAATNGLVVDLTTTATYTEASESRSLVTQTSSTTYSDGVTSIASVMSETGSKRAITGSASPLLSSSTASSEAIAASAPAYSMGMWQSAAAALGGLVGIAVLL